MHQDMAMHDMVAVTQGIYYLLTGIWPVVHMRSFERVTGAKTDKWLVKTTGFILADVGVVLIFGGGDTAKLLGVSVAAILAVIGIFYGLKGTISKIYVVEAVFEMLIVAAWLFSGHLYFL